ncbi:MAG: tyrosine-type recombinase/integrase [Eubacterium sp.]|nr:tyrosine-type recombinase/integrase [Eubacterium sp.]
MARTKKTPFPPWFTTRADGIEKRYIRLGVTLTSSEAFRDLSNSAVRIYLNMMMEAGGNKDFTFPCHKYINYMSKQTFFTARTELVNHGFITIKQNNRSCLNTQLKRFLKGTKFEYLTLHKLRHTNATLLLNNGVDLKIVSDHLGHSDIQITAKTYTAVLDSSRMKTAELMEHILTEQTPNKHQMLGIG